MRPFLSIRLGNRELDISAPLVSDSPLANSVNVESGGNNAAQLTEAETSNLSVSNNVTLGNHVKTEPHDGSEDAAKRGLNLVPYFTV